MAHEFTRKIICFAVLNGIIKEEDRELCEYSYEMMFARIFSFLTLLVIGAFFNCIIGVLVFYLTFSPLRIYAGGFHSRGYIGCYLASVAAFIAIALIYGFVGGAWTAPLCVLGSVASGIIIFCKAPIADPNKPLDERETKKYQEKARLIVSVELFIVVVISRISILEQIFFFMSAALIMEALLLLIPCSKEPDNA